MNEEDVIPTGDTVVDAENQVRTAEVDKDIWENDDVDLEFDDMGFQPVATPSQPIVKGPQDLDAYELAEKQDVTMKQFDKLAKGDYNEALDARDNTRVQPEFEKIQAAEFSEQADNEVSYMADIARGVGSGVRNAVQGVINTVADLADWATDLRDPDFYSNLAKEYELPEGWETRTAVGGMAETVTQFVAGFIPAMRLMRIIQRGKALTVGQQAAARKILGPTTAGAITDFTVWDIQDKRLIDMVEELGGSDTAQGMEGYLNAEEGGEQSYLDDIEEGLIKALKYDKNDSNMMNRFRQGAEGALFGKLLDGLFSMAKMTKKMKTTDKGRGQLLKERDDIIAKKDKATPQEIERAKEIDNHLEKNYGEGQSKETHKSYKDRMLGEGKKAKPRDLKISSKTRAKVRKAIETNNEKSIPGIIAASIKKDWNSASHVDDWDDLNDMLTELVTANKEITETTAASMKRQAAKALKDADQLKEMEDYVEGSYDQVALEAKAGIINQLAQQASIENAKKLAAGTLTRTEFATLEAENMIKRAYFAEGGSNWGRQGVIRKKMLRDGRANAAKVWKDANKAAKIAEKNQPPKVGDRVKLGPDQTGRRPEGIVEEVSQDGQVKVKVAEDKSVLSNFDELEKVAKKEVDGPEIALSRTGEDIVEKYHIEDDAARFIANLDPEGIYPTDMLDRLSRPNWGDAMIELYVNSILSTTSLGVNITSNIFMMFARSMDTFAAGANGKDATLTQALYQAYGLFNGFSDSLRMMFKPAKELGPLDAKRNPLVAAVRSYGEDKALFSRSREFVNEFTPEQSITSKNLGYQNPTSTMEKMMNTIIDVGGKVVRGHPGGVRSMMATDEMFKVMNYRAHLHKTAAEAAEKAGYTLGQPEFGKFVSDFVDKSFAAPKISKGSDPTIYQKASVSAMDMSHEMTFTSPWAKQGFFGQGENMDKMYSYMRRQPLFSLIFPFVRQPTNNLLYVARTTPGLNLLSGKLSRAMQKGGAEAEIAEAQIGVASWIWSVLGLYALGQGNLTTGTATSATSTAANEFRDMNIGDYSTMNKDGDFINYRGAEPFSPRLAIMSTMLNHWSSLMAEHGAQMTDDEFLEHAGGMAAVGGLGIMKQMKDMSSLQGLSNIMKMFDAENPAPLQNFIVGIISPMAGAIKYFNENYNEDDDPNVDGIDGGLNELIDIENYKSNPDTFFERWLNRYGVNTTPAVNIFGDYKAKATPMEIGDFTGNDPLGVLGKIPTNIRRTPGFKTKGQREILRLKQAMPDKAVLGTIPRSIEGVKLSAVEKHNLMKFFKHTTLDGLTFEQRMVQNMSMGTYIEGSNEFKALMMKKSWEQYMKVAKASLLADTERYSRNGKNTKVVPGLLPYRRSKSLSYAASRKKARDAKRLVGDFGEVIDVNEYSMDVGEAVNESGDYLDEFFN